MSKSLHNSLTVQEALKQYSANELRLAFYQTNYRKPFDYTKTVMEQGIALRRKIFQAYAISPEKTDQQVFDAIIDALSDDLDSPKALQLWGENAQLINKKDTETLFNIFGLKYMPITENESVNRLAEERDAARSTNDFLTADNRKAEIEQAGYEVVDTVNGTIYIPR